MFTVEVDNSPLIAVSNGRHRASYATDGSQMNPLEAFYATLAGCAGVYAQKACKELGVSAAGIRIECRPFAGPAGTLSLSRFRTELSFPDRFTDEQRTRVLDTVSQCAVKKIVEAGGHIGFAVADATVSAKAL
jgi:uncharacterized OsmC-like protein